MPIYDSTLDLLRKKQTLAGLKNNEDVLLPNYHGYSLANLTPSISRWLGGPDLPAPVFSDEILKHFAPGYKRVVVLLVDALG